MDVQIVKRPLRATSTDLFTNSFVDVQDWRSFIVRNFNQPFTANVVKNLNNFMVINNETYYRGNWGMLARFLSLAKEKEEQHWHHELSYGIMMLAYTSDYKSTYTTGLRWPRMLLTDRRLVCNTKSPLIWRSRYSYRKQESEGNLIFPCCTVLLWNWPWRSKGKLKSSLSKCASYNEKVLSNASEVSCKKWSDDGS